ncbi:heterokaryon incompatibility protein-domain-containing protein [Alternaria rosae]|uniref:heterokaryon incompatibility protein-domain-containing protein n=1 Tax=Alternaria rosae TaxID=1187941 RepID=UPI001E8D2C2A|nr:heterokaryon incompatibility protein-domain-containing protein [Alternaria rosae]KAH6870797.1 heterokaryon incompatibility protein-domain-containing protein [Alternaria rosae]
MADLYAVLRLKPAGQVRLVNILPGSHSDPLACELQVVNIPDKKEEYVALSYTWGSPKPLENKEAEARSSQPQLPLLCMAKSQSNDRSHQAWHQILVTENLHAFLLRARDNDTHIRNSYWIDAICIDQNDADERTHQVRMMGTIYQSAKMVYAWLGEEDKDTSIAFRLITTLMSSCRSTERRKRIEGLMDITPKGLGTPALSRRLGECANVIAWTSMANLFQRRYFTRAWIIQEITLAKKMIALCGSHTVGWEAITTVSEFLVVTSWTRWIARMTGSQQASHGVPNVLDVNKSSKSLLYSLIRSRRFVSIDPRDKVYSLLGIAGESVALKSRLSPVYGERSVAETYTLAAIQILEDSDDLLLLSCAEGDRFRNIASAPSWVPDWSCDRALGLGITGYKRFAAAGNLPRVLSVNEWDRCLTVQGFRLDDVVASGEDKETILNGKPFPGWLRIFEAMPPTYHTGQTRSEVFWRTLITDTAGVPPRYPAPDSYHAAYVSWITSMLSARVEDMLQSTEDPAFMNAITALVATNITGSSSSSNAALGLHGSVSPTAQEDTIGFDEFETTFSHALHLRLFLTGRRYLGVGSGSLLEQDSIWIVPGSRVPLILRQIDIDTFRLVGGAYVHGFMQGEALVSNPIFRSITLK